MDFFPDLMHVLQPSSYLNQVATWTRLGTIVATKTYACVLVATSTLYSHPGSYLAVAAQTGSYQVVAW